MTKFVWIFCVLCILGCGSKIAGVKNNPAIDFSGQEATVEANIISRGKFQYLLAISSGEKAGKYLPEDLPEEFCEDGLKVKFDGELMRKKGIVYKPGPTDIPEKDYELPMIRLLGITRR